MNEDSSDDRDPVEALAEEFILRRRRGEHPSLSEYTSLHPELADQIREYFPALVMLDEIDPRTHEFVQPQQAIGPLQGAFPIDQLGDFRILREVGRGGMGIVYEAEQMSLDRRVALKVLPQQTLSNAIHVQRFEREAKSAAKLHHTNIVPVFGVGMQAGVHYYVMQFIQGLGLDQVIDELKRIQTTSPGGMSTPREFHISKRSDISAVDVACSLLTGRYLQPMTQNESIELQGSFLAINPDFQRTNDESFLSSPHDAGHPLAPTVFLQRYGEAGKGTQHANHDPILDPAPRASHKIAEEPLTQSLLPEAGEREPNDPREPTVPKVVSQRASDIPILNPSCDAREPAVPVPPGRLSDSFSVATAGNVLQGLGSDSDASRESRKQTYWHSVGHIGRQTAEALQYAHEQGVLHRDIKPANLLLDIKGTVWVTDFGLAKAIGEHNLTGGGDILGTLRYMPPEAFSGITDVRSDVYSLGLTLYEMLALQPAFREQDRNRLLKQVMSSEPDRLDVLNREIPRDLATIVHKAIEHEPKRRYQSARDLADDLNRYLNDESIHARRITPFERVARWSRRNRWFATSLAGIGALLLVIAIGSTIAAAYLQQQNRIQSTLIFQKQQLADVANAERKSAVAAEREAVAQRQRAESNLAKSISAEEDARRQSERRRQLLYVTDTQLVSHTISSEHVTAREVDELLSAQVPETGETDLRGFEWWYLRRQLNDNASVYQGHAAPVVTSALTDDRRLVTLDVENTLKHWNPETRQEQWSFDLKRGRKIERSALSRDGRFAAVAVQSEIFLYDTESGKELFVFASPPVPHDSQVLPQLIFSDDCQMLVSVAPTTCWWNTQTGRQIASSTLKAFRCMSAALSSDGTTLFIGGDGPVGEFVNVHRLDSNNREVRLVCERIMNIGSIKVVSCSSDGQWFAAGNSEGTIALAKTNGAGPVTTVAAHAGDISALSFSNDGCHLATAAGDGLIKVWRLSASGAPAPIDGTATNPPKIQNDTAVRLDRESALKGHLDAVSHLSFSRDGRRLLSSSRDRSSRIWSLQRTEQSKRELEKHSGGCFGAKFSPNGLFVAAASTKDQVIHIWDSASKRIARSLPLNGGRSTCVAFSPDHRNLAVGHRESFVSLWDIDTGLQVAEFSGIPMTGGHEAYSAVGALAYSPDGRYLIAGFGAPYFVFTPSPGPMKIWDVMTRQQVRQLDGHLNSVVGITFSPDGTLMASCSYDGTTRIWNPRTWETIRTLKIPDTEPDGANSRVHVTDVAFSPDGRMLATSTDTGLVLLWNVDTGQVSRTLTGHSNAVGAVAFWPGGRTVVSAGQDHSIRFWNIATGRIVLATTTDSCQTLSFSPDGMQLICGGMKEVLISDASRPIWDDPAAAATKLAELLDASVDFRSRIRMLSGQARLYEALEALARLRPNEPRVLTALAAARAESHARMGRWTASVQAYDSLVAQDAVNPTGWLAAAGGVRIAQALYKVDRRRDAQAGLQRALRQVAMDGPISSDELPQLVTELSRDIERDTTNVSAFEIRSELHGILENRAAQIEDVARLVELQPKNPKLLYQYALLLERNGMRREAAGAFMRLSDLDGSNAEWQRRLGLLGPDVIAVWNFDSGREGWQADSADVRMFQKEGSLNLQVSGAYPGFLVPVSAPAGPTIMAIRLRARQPTTLIVFWHNAVSLGASDTAFLNIAPSDDWQDLEVSMNSAYPLVRLRLGFDKAPAGHQVEVDYIALRNVKSDARRSPNSP